MAYGASFTNDDNVVVLDSEYARLSVIFKGRYAPNSNGGQVAIVNFPYAITTQEPPLVFFRPDAVGIASGGGGPLGTPGNWTGLRIVSTSVNYAQPNGLYFVAAFTASPVETFGLGMWDGAGSLIFNSGTPSALFTRCYQNWAYERNEYNPPYYTNFYKCINDLPSANEYILANTFVLPMVAGNAPGRSVAVIWDFNSSSLRAMTSGTSNPYAFYLPALFAKMNQ